MGKLDNRVAIITGATSGIGKATAILFAKEGAKVVIVGRKNGKRVKEEIKKKGGESIFIKCDVSSSDDVRKLVKYVLKKFHRIDILFNNAGIGDGGSVDKTSEEKWSRVIDTNLKGVFLCSKYVIPHMKNGVIINNASMLGLVGGKDTAVYSASKGGIISMTRSMALDYAPDIRVNCICPGPIDTPLLRKWTSPEELAKIKTRVALRRLGKPEEVANVALFLASDDASYVTGAIYTVNGG